jgi:hypothetical protein
LRKKQALLKSYKGTVAKANEEHKGLVEKAEALAAETLAVAERIASFEAKIEVVEKEVQEVFGKMAGGEAEPPIGPVPLPQEGRANEFTEAERAEMYAIRAGRHEQAMEAQAAQQAAAVAAAVLEERRRAELRQARLAAIAAERLAAEGAGSAAGVGQQVPPEAVGEGERAGEVAAATGPLASKMAAHAAERRAASAPYTPARHSVDPPMEEGDPP